MQIHEIKPATKTRSKKRVGRGGVHGTYSTRGVKGQKSRSGFSARPGFEGGRTPLKKLLPKKRGVGFSKLSASSFIVTIDVLNKKFEDNETVNIKTLIDKKIIKHRGQKFKILANGDIDHPVKVEKCDISNAAKEKILKAGGQVD